MDTNTVNISYVAPAVTPYGSYYPEANLASNFGENGTYGYYLADADSLVLLGVRGNGVSTAFADRACERKYPLAFNESFTDSFSVTQTSGESTTTVSGRRTCTYDAYGTLIVNQDTVANVIRLRIIEKGIMTMDDGATVLHNESETFEWVSATSPKVLLRITYTSMNADDFANAFKTVAVSSTLLP